MAQPKKHHAITHGMTNTPLYRRWHAMMQRCYHPSQDSYAIYGAKGIGVCSRWHDFNNFVDDMGKIFKPGLSLDRIDNTKGYSEENCRWATMREQQNNKSSNRLFEINGITKTLSQWCDLTTVKRSTVRQRFYVYGWDIQRSLGIGG